MSRFPVLICFVFASLAQAQEIRFLRSLSGPSGHASGTTFVFDEVRSRFVFPEDKSFIVYMEWSAPPGLHTISAVWKSPDGKASLSPDVKVDLPNGVLSAYWTFTIKPDDISGVWTLEARVDGQPGGSHNFELYVPGRRNTTDEIYRSVQKSLVVVSALDARGERMDMSLGFVFGQDLIATAFQSIDGASAISVLFSDGFVARADSLAGWNRSSDWALIPVPTGSRSALRVSSSGTAKIGARALAFTLDDNNKKDPVAAVVVLTGRTNETVRFNPALPPVSAGSPVLNDEGGVMGIVGAWGVPGSRIPGAIASDPATCCVTQTVTAMAPAEAIAPQKSTATLRSLTDGGVLTPPITHFVSLIELATTDTPNKNESLPDRNVTEFSSRRPGLWLVTYWQRREKVKSAVITSAVYDSSNRKRAECAPKKVSFSETATRVTQQLSLAGLESGNYRVDVIADGTVVGRRTIKIVN